MDADLSRWVRGSHHYREATTLARAFALGSPVEKPIARWNPQLSRNARRLKRAVAAQCLSWFLLHASFSRTSAYFDMQQIGQQEADRKSGQDRDKKIDSPSLAQMVAIKSSVAVVDNFVIVEYEFPQFTSLYYDPIASSTEDTTSSATTAPTTTIVHSKVASTSSSMFLTGVVSVLALVGVMTRCIVVASTMTPGKSSAMLDERTHMKTLEADPTDQIRVPSRNAHLSMRVAIGEHSNLAIIFQFTWTLKHHSPSNHQPHTHTPSHSRKMMTSIIKKTVLVLPLLVAMYTSAEGVRAYSFEEDTNSTTTTGSLDWSEEVSGSYSADSDSGSGFIDAFHEAARAELSGDDFDGSGVADGWSDHTSGSDSDAISNSNPSSSSHNEDRVGDDAHESFGYDYDGSDGWANSSSSSDTGCDDSVGENPSGSDDDADYDGSDVADGWSTKA
ncbi:hypothetical protein FI667_g15359, partial [Globisporangium splendens]